MPMALRKYRGPGLWIVLSPKWQGAWARIREERANAGSRAALLALLAIGFWSGVFGVLYRVLSYFRGVAEIGDLLSTKLLGLVLLTFWSILLLSNVITALSSFFLAKDLDLLAASPVHSIRFYLAKLVETMLHSSWMVVLLAVPLFAAYGMVYSGGPLWPVVVLGAFIPFIVLPAVVGSTLTLLLVNLVPARRAKELLSLIAIGAIGGLALLLRLAQPERLVRPEGFRSLADFVAMLEAPTNPLLPSEWAMRMLMNWLLRVADPKPVLELWVTAGVLLALGGVLFRWRYRHAFSKAQEGAPAPAGGRGWAAVVDLLLPWVPQDRREFILKDARLFFRDPTQWSQLILLGVLVVVYLFNVQALPLFSGEQVPAAVVALVVFLNLGLAGFVLAAIAARFLFPSVSLEGRQMWLLRSSPLDLRSMLWSKYWIGTAPLLVLAVLITTITNAILRSSPFMVFVSEVTMVLFTLAASALALSFGTFYPRLDTENAAQIPTSFGGLVYMMASVLLLAVVIMLEAPAVATQIRAEQLGVDAAWNAELILPVVLAVVLCMASTVLPLRFALARMRRLEF
jgi:ABC-2 type transport system permease protein